MKRREFITLLGGAAAAWPLAARAQQGGKKSIVGRFNAGSVTDPLNEVLTEALRELGWVEGENVVFERRYAENRLERLPELALWRVELSRHSRPSVPPRPSRSLWHRPAIRWGVGSWPVWRDLAAMSPG